MNILVAIVCVASIAFLLRFWVALISDKRKAKKRKVTVYHFKEQALAAHRKRSRRGKLISTALWSERPRAAGD